jgi:hypothetical protein
VTSPADTFVLVKPVDQGASYQVSVVCKSDVPEPFGPWIPSKSIPKNQLKEFLLTKSGISIVAMIFFETVNAIFSSFFFSASVINAERSAMKCNEFREKYERTRSQLLKHICQTFIPKANPKGEFSREKKKVACFDIYFSTKKKKFPHSGVMFVKWSSKIKRKRFPVLRL